MTTVREAAVRGMLRATDDSERGMVMDFIEVAE